MVIRLSDRAVLHNGIEMPRLGFGVYQVEDGSEVIESVKEALHLGYRSIDTAAIYKNEEGVGQAIREAGISREELFITTKVWNNEQGYDHTMKAFDKSLHRLGLDYVDLYLIHWPVDGKYKDTWKALERIYKTGKAKAIGVSNFHEHHLEDLMESAEINPMVNQIELHPRLTQVKLRSFCKENQIQVEAWSPIMRGKLLQNFVLNQLAEKYGKSPAQVVLRWHVQNDVIAIPKSVHADRIRENADIFDFELTSVDMASIDRLNENERVGPDPDHFEF